MFQTTGWKTVFAVNAFEDGILLHQSKNDQDLIEASVLQKRCFMEKWQFLFLKDIDINFFLEPLVLGKKPTSDSKIHWIYFYPNPKLPNRTLLH